jgi:hypothetical protein
MSLIAGRLSHKTAVVFAGLERFLWVWLIGSRNVMSWVYGSKMSATEKGLTEMRNWVLLHTHLRYGGARISWIGKYRPASWSAASLGVWGFLARNSPARCQSQGEMVSFL